MILEMDLNPPHFFYIFISSFQSYDFHKIYSEVRHLSEQPVYTNCFTNKPPIPAVYRAIAVGMYRYILF